MCESQVGYNLWYLQMFILLFKGTIWCHGDDYDDGTSYTDDDYDISHKQNKKIMVKIKKKLLDILFTVYIVIYMRIMCL